MSDSIEWIFHFRTGKKATNYLDDFTFITLLEWACNDLIMKFLEICKEINFPISMKETQWGTQIITFLGILLNSVTQTISIPVEKYLKAMRLLHNFINKKKVTVLQVQQLVGLLNFLCKGIVVGCLFTHCFYQKGVGLKQYHHIRVDAEMKLDCAAWLQFLEHPSSVARPMIDFDKCTFNAEELQFFSDATKARNLGYGTLFASHWCYQMWEPGLIQKYDPSIEYLELYAITVVIFLWAHKLENKRVVIFCDNESLVFWINKLSASC